MPCHKVYEDDDHMAFMDIYPPTFNGKITMPNVLVVTKKHYKSDLFEDLADDVYEELLRVSKKVARAIKKGINPMRVCLVFEGMEIDHIHVKLYPIFKEYYPNYLSTEKSPGNKPIRASDEALSNIATKIMSMI